MPRMSLRNIPRFYDRRKPLDILNGYVGFVDRTVSNVVESATPIITDKVVAAATPIITNSVFSVLQTIQTDLGRRSSSGKGNSFNISGLNLAYGQGLANVGGQYVVTNESGRNGTTSAAKAILSSYNKYRGKR